MDSQIVAVFCLCDDMLKGLHHLDDCQCQMTGSEVMTTAIIAALHFRCNFELARHFLQDEGYIPHMLGKKGIRTKGMQGGLRPPCIPFVRDILPSGI